MGANVRQVLLWLSSPQTISCGRCCALLLTNVAKCRAADEQRRVMLRGIMTMEARERLNRVAIVKPENARAVEEHLIRLARSGKLTAKVGVRKQGRRRLLPRHADSKLTGSAQARFVQRPPTAEFSDR